MMAAAKCCRKCLYVCVCVFALHTSGTNDAPCCRWRGFFFLTRKVKRNKTEHAKKQKPGRSATQHNYYFANVGALKKCLLGSAERGCAWHFT